MTNSGGYNPPNLLQDLHVLDLLELAGSQAKAGAALAMHQSTVCRSLRLMQRELRLTPRQGQPVCRHGHNDCLQHLRLAYRAHRLMVGILRIGTDLLHQPLISSLPTVQQVPPRFRSAERWAQLIRHGLLDGAIVSSLALDNRLLSGQAPLWDGLVAKSLGTLALQLMASDPQTQRVLLPNRSTAPLLHRAVDWQGMNIEIQPSACQDPAAWLKRAQDRAAALPICPDLADKTWLSKHCLAPLQQQPPLVEQIWLLIPNSMGNDSTTRLALRELRSRINHTKSIQVPHDFDC